MFYDKFKELCDQRGISCNKAAIEIGLSNATPTKWKKTGAVPGGDTLNKIASYFGVSVSTLLAAPYECPSDDENPWEIELLDAFEKLDIDSQIETVQRVKSRVDQKEKTPESRQAHERTQYAIQLFDSFTPEQKEEALRYLEFLASRNK